jgi:hypothetical protein
MARWLHGFTWNVINTTPSLTGYEAVLAFVLRGHSEDFRGTSFQEETEIVIVDSVGLYSKYIPGFTRPSGWWIGLRGVRVVGSVAFQDLSRATPRDPNSRVKISHRCAASRCIATNLLLPKLNQAIKKGATQSDPRTGYPFVSVISAL